MAETPICGAEDCSEPASVALTLLVGEGAPKVCYGCKAHTAMVGEMLKVVGQEWNKTDG